MHLTCSFNLVELKLPRNKNLVNFSGSIWNMRRIEILKVSKCEQLEELHDQLGMITSLRELNVMKATMLKLAPDISQLSEHKIF